MTPGPREKERSRNGNPHPARGRLRGTQQRHQAAPWCRHHQGRHDRLGRFRNHARRPGLADQPDRHLRDGDPRHEAGRPPRGLQGPRRRRRREPWSVQPRGRRHPAQPSGHPRAGIGRSGVQPDSWFFERPVQELRGRDVHELLLQGLPGHDRVVRPRPLAHRRLPLGSGLRRLPLVDPLGSGLPGACLDRRDHVRSDPRLDRAQPEHPGQPRVQPPDRVQPDLGHHADPGELHAVARLPALRLAAYQGGHGRHEQHLGAVQRA